MNDMRERSRRVASEKSTIAQIFVVNEKTNLIDIGKINHHIVNVED